VHVISINTTLAIPHWALFGKKAYGLTAFMHHNNQALFAYCAAMDK
jgi:hypothetical protein